MKFYSIFIEPPPANCTDFWDEKWCKENSKQCNKKDHYTKCMKTCDKCDEYPPEPICEDEIDKKLCKIKKKLGLCKNVGTYFECMKTCNNCDEWPFEPDCEDQKTQKWCKKRQKHCSKKAIYKNCEKTCNKCDEKPSEPDCKDQKPKKWCKMRKDLCSKSKPHAAKCKKTCKQCKLM